MYKGKRNNEFGLLCKRFIAPQSNYDTPETKTLAFACFSTKTTGCLLLSSKVGETDTNLVKNENEIAEWLSG